MQEVITAETDALERLGAIGSRGRKDRENILGVEETQKPLQAGTGGCQSVSEKTHSCLISSGTCMLHMATHRHIPPSCLSLWLPLQLSCVRPFSSLYIVSMH